MLGIAIKLIRSMILPLVLYVREGRNHLKLEWMLGIHSCI